MSHDAGPDDRPVESGLRDLLAPLDRNLERGRSLLAAALVFSPAPFILLWLLQYTKATESAGWAVLTFGLLILLGLAWEIFMARYARWRFDRCFPEHSASRPVALRLLAEIETPNRIEEQLRDALGASLHQRIVGRPDTDLIPSRDTLPALELPPAEPASTPAPVGPPPAAGTRPGGYYDYIPLEPLPSEEPKEGRPGA